VRPSAQSTSTTAPGRRSRRPGAWLGWLFAAPAVVVYATFVLRPLLLTIQYSLYDWDGIGPSSWVGLANYGRLFTDRDLLDPILHAFELIVFFSFVPVVLGLLVASTIRRIAESRLAVVGLGGLTRAWLGDFGTALPAVGVIGAWVLVGLCTLLLLAGMSKIDAALYEAARLDGAGPVREFFSITLPSLRQELGVAVTVTVIAALASFDVLYVSTQGGPGNATMVPGLEIYYLAFSERKVGVASALAVALMVLVLACILPIQRFTRDGSR
jgi:raffinose/stachyose/melibiose transport system permease protein